MPRQPLISVLMPVYNPAPDWLRQAIGSVEQQIYPQWELCIADDCSTDPAVHAVLDNCLLLAGHLLAHSVPDPAAFGLDFMLVAFAAAIGMGLWRGRSDLAPALAAGLVGLALHRWLPGGWYIVGAGLAAGAVGAWRHGR